MKTTLALTKMPDAGGVTNYNVMLNISGGGWQDAPSIQGSIKVAYHDRVDLRKAIDDLTTVINVLFGAQGTLRGKMPKVSQNQPLDSLSELGDLMYRLFLPTVVQRHLSGVETPILVASNDLELPWELMYPENDFLCLRAPVGRMPMMRDFPRRNEYQREEKLRFLFLANPTGDLPAAEKEVEWIADRLTGEPATVEVWRGEEVTGLKLHRALASGRYDVIHYSGHAFFNPENPDESGLLLAGQNVFIAQTIQRTLRGRPLIFLNACESGREMMAEGEVSYVASETEGLASSFILGGALAIMGTMWPIFDEGAAEFASAFYENILAGQSLGEATRQARLHLRNSRPHDVTWASFVLYGDPTLNILE
jgi:CHAT domain-containing protein